MSQNQESNTGLIVVSVLIPIVGIIAGPVMMGNGKAGGGAVLGAGIGGFVLWSLLTTMATI